MAKKRVVKNKKKNIKKSNTSKKSNSRKKRNIKKNNVVKKNNINKKKNETKKENNLKSNDINFKEKNKNINNNVKSKTKRDIKTNKKKKDSFLKVNKLFKKFNFKIIKIFGILTIFLIGLLFISFLINKQNNKIGDFNYVSFDEYMDLYSSNKVEFIYLIKNDCAKCEIANENLILLQKEYNFKFNVLNIDEIDDDSLELLKSSNSYIKNGMDVPILLSISNGKELKYENANKEYSVLKKFVELSFNPSDSYSFNKINLNDYMNLLEKDGTNLIYICRPNEKECDNFSLILDEVSKKRKINVNYLNMDTIVTSEEWDLLNNSNKIFNDIWFTPVLMVVKNGKLKDYKMESLTQNQLTSFLKKNGL